MVPLLDQSYESHDAEVHGVLSTVRTVAVGLSVRPLEQEAVEKLLSDNGTNLSVLQILDRAGWASLWTV